MGIDIFAHCRAEDADEPQWLCIDQGHLGYLREAYHGAPYATRVLVPEAFEHPDGAAISAATLKARLPKAIDTAIERQRVIYGEDADHPTTQRVVQSFRDFVALCARAEVERGEPCRITAWH